MLLNMPQEWLQKLEKIEWAHFYATPHAEVCLGIFSAHLPEQLRSAFLKEHHQRHETLKKSVQRIREQTPVVRAEHLIQAGIAPGIKMGQLLKEAERISVNQSIDDPEAIIEKLKKQDLWNS
jgi:hypothetical protein